MMIFMNKIADRLRWFREEYLKTDQTSIGKPGMSQTTWSGWEANPPKALQHLLDLADKYSVSIDFILGRTNNPVPVSYLIRRRAQDAGIPAPSPHAFRRAFARNAWLAGMDLLSIRRLLGHSSLAVIERYIKSFNDDLQAIHEKHSPVDNL